MGWTDEPSSFMIDTSVKTVQGETERQTRQYNAALDSHLGEASWLYSDPLLALKGGLYDNFGFAA